MNTNSEYSESKAKLTIVLLGGIAIGMAGAAVIHAQQATAPPAYIIAEVEKDLSKKQDSAASRKYAEEAPKTLAAFDGKYIVRGAKAQTLEGEVSTGNIVVIAFDSLEKARAWYNSPAYEALKPIRQNSTKSRLLLVEGVIPKS
jgi:uncharacterized protein (DUF1330 family)